MTALPPEQMRALRETARDAASQQDEVGRRWHRLEETLQRIAQLAAITPDQPALSPQAFALALAEAQEWQRDMALQGMEDVEALTETGLQALTILAGRQAPTAVPALALWREVYRAREAIISLLTPQRAAA